MVWQFAYNNTLNGNGYPLYQQFGYRPAVPYTNGNPVQDINAQIIQSIRMLSQNLRAMQAGQYVPGSWLDEYRQMIRTNPFDLSEIGQQYGILQNNGAKKTKTLSVEFVNRVKEISAKIKCDYRDLLGVMNSESGLNPKARNKSSGAIGLIQFTDIAIKDLNQAYGLKLTKDKIAKMSAMEQLDLVEKYLTRVKSFKFNSDKKLDAADLYAIVYRPKFAGKEVIATRRDGATYNLNKGLDVNKDGVITRSDLAQAVKRKHINVNLVA